MDVSNGGASSSQDDHGGGMSSDDGGSGEKHVDLILLDSVGIGNSAGVLGHTFTLASENGLVDVEAVALHGQNSAVSGNSITNCHRYNVTRHQIVGLDACDVSIAYDLGLVGRVFLESGDGLLGAGFLRDSNDGIEDEDGENLVRGQ